MRTLSDDTFLSWVAQSGLIPDPRYPSSRQQLVFVNAPECWSSWTSPDEPNARKRLLESLLDLLAPANSFRVRLRGGGSFFGASDSERERFLSAALTRVGVPTDASGAIEFENSERGLLLDLATAFLDSGYRVETDLEIVPANRAACVMLTHGGVVVVQMSGTDALQTIVDAMATAGFTDDATKAES
jgi:hypothetical protein